MLIGITGKPSSGKSTFFSAATLVDVPISPRPFTTIDPNKGVTYVQVNCPCAGLGTKCNPKSAKCENGKRFVAINMIDVAGLVPGAHEGKGLGNRFLDDVRSADALIQVVDASGKTDSEGNPCENYDPATEIRFLEEEIGLWIASILQRGWSKVKLHDIKALHTLLTGLKITEAEIEKTAKKLGLSTERINWGDDDIRRFSEEIRRTSMPIVIAANKIDLPSAHENYMNLRAEFPDRIIVPAYADGELALRKAAAKKLVEYFPGDIDFKILAANDAQKAALQRIKQTVSTYHGTGVQQIINSAVFGLLGLIVVYPVSDENKFTDNFGNVLPDAIFVRKGTTAFQLAEKIHTDLAKNFIYAIDARKKIRIAKDHILNDGDIVRIVSGAR